MIEWNPNPVAFTIPLLDLPVYIYGICFVTGFIIAYYILIWRLEKAIPEMGKSAIRKLVDQLTWFVVLGTIVGARLGHVFLYDWEHYKHNPWLILNTREGGLASHGGTIGILIALALFYFLKFKKTTGLSFLQLLDQMVIPAAIAACFIRIGNFFNQEILGTPSNLPWAVLFGTPADGTLPVPRHPAQLYEAFAYLLTFGILFLVKARRPGFLTGLFFVLVFSSRFLIEFVKEHQASVLDQSLLQAGQTLSLPFIIAGIYLMVRPKIGYYVKL